MALTNFTDWSAAGNTTIAAGAPPQAGSASVGGGSAAWTDYGASSLCLYNIVSGVLKNNRTNSPGSSFINTGLIRQVSEDFDDGEAWCRVNSGEYGGLIGRYDRASGAGLGINYQGGTFYIYGRKETGDAFLFDTTAIATTIPAEHVLHLRLANIGAQSVSLVGEIHTTAVDTAAPTAATRLFRKILTIDVSNTDRDVLAGSGGWGVGNIGAGAWTKFWSYDAGATLTKGESSADIVAISAVRFSYTAATGGTGTKVFSLVQDGAVVVADIGTTGTYTRTGLTAGTSYEFKIRCTDGAATVVDYDVMPVTTLAANAIVLGVGIDSNQANNYGIDYTLKAAAKFKDLCIARGRQAVVVYGAIAGTTMAGWASTGLGFNSSFVTNDGNPLGVNTYIYQGGTNDAKTTGQRTKAQFKADALDVVTYTITNATASGTTGLRVFFATAPTIPAGATDWDATSTTRISEYLAAMQELVAADTTGKLKMLDSAFYAESITNAADWNLATNDVHYNAAAHLRQSQLWLAGWPDAFPTDDKDYIMTVNSMVEPSVTASWASVGSVSAGDVVRLSCVGTIQAQYYIGTSAPTGNGVPLTLDKPSILTVGSGKTLYLRGVGGVPSVVIEIGTA